MKLPASGDQRPRRGSIVMNAKTHMSNGGGAQDHMPNGGGAGHPRGADVATIAGQYSCTSLISRAFPHLWPRGAEISFCLTIDHCRTILYYTVLLLDLALRRRYCRLFTLLFRPGSPTGLQTLTPPSGLPASPRPRQLSSGFST